MEEHDNSKICLGGYRSSDPSQGKMYFFLNLFLLLEGRVQEGDVKIKQTARKDDI